MKTIFRYTFAAVFALAFAGLATVNASAQGACDDVDAITAVDAKIRGNYGDIKTRKVAVEASKEYLEKYGECASTADFVAWLKPQVPKWEQQVKEWEEYQWLKPRLDRFDAGIKAGSYDDTYAAGTEILGRYPDNMNIMVPLGLIGLYETYKNNHKHNDASIRYATMAISKLQGGATATKKNKAGEDVFGAFQYERNRAEAISELTYALGYIHYYAKKDKKAGLPYFYQVTQLPGAYKTEPRVYATFGGFYMEEADVIGKEIIALLEKQKAAATDEEKETIEKEIKAKEALYNGYAERALDAFGRAYNNADESIASEKTLKQTYHKHLQDIYQQRFQKKDGLESYISASTNKPLPNPTSEVQPVSDPEPDKDSDSTTTSGAAGK